MLLICKLDSNPSIFPRWALPYCGWRLKFAGATWKLCILCFPFIQKLKAVWHDTSLLLKMKCAKSIDRNWLDLPQDVMIHIFIKLGVVDLLYTAQKVCSLWENLSKEPQIFRCIDMRNYWDVLGGPDYLEEYDEMVKDALSRCVDGELVELSVGNFCSDEHIYLAIEKCKPNLRCLRLVSAYNVSDDALIEITKKNPLLEEIELCLCCYGADTIGVVGRSCPQLKSFWLNAPAPVKGDSGLHADSDMLDFNEAASAIAINMPQLRGLHLFNNLMNNKSLESILDKCSHLEYLDLRQCFGLDLTGDLLQKCRVRVRYLMLPNEPVV